MSKTKKRKNRSKSKPKMGIVHTIEAMVSNHLPTQLAQIQTAFETIIPRIEASIDKGFKENSENHQIMIQHMEDTKNELASRLVQHEDKISAQGSEQARQSAALKILEWVIIGGVAVTGISAAISYLVKHLAFK